MTISAISVTISVMQEISGNDQVNNVTQHDADKPAKPAIPRDAKGRILPGHSLNPAGPKPKQGGGTQRNPSFTQMLRDRADPQRLADQLLKLANAGEMQAIRYVYDRLEGYPAQRKDVNLKEDLNVTLVWSDGSPVTAPLSAAQRQRQAAITEAVVDGDYRELESEAEATGESPSSAS